MEIFIKETFDHAPPLTVWKKINLITLLSNVQNKLILQRCEALDG